MDDTTHPYGRADEAAGGLVRQLHQQLKTARTAAACIEVASAARLAATRATDFPDPIAAAYLTLVTLAERRAEALAAEQGGAALPESPAAGPAGAAAGEP